MIDPGERKRRKERWDDGGETESESKRKERRKGIKVRAEKEEPAME